LSEYNLPKELHYSKDDEWVRDDGDGRCAVGITDFAQQQLGDIVFVELPEIGARLRAGDSFGVIESVKAVSDLYAPIDGKVVEINDTLEDSPEAVNESCYELGWIIVLEADSASQVQALMNATDYEASVVERAD
jgi:glycine cleavage system H protein